MIDKAMCVISLLCSLILLPLWGPLWLICRLWARPCPNCQSRWSTELNGEWDGIEEWHCDRCGQWFDQTYWEAL